MVTITNYTIEHNPQKDVYRIICKEILFCPMCGEKLSGYDTRRRHIVDAAGYTHWLLLQRYRCPKCKKLHVAAPSFVIPKKHYEATVIAEAKAGRVDFCPADNSTIRRWRR